EVNFSQTAGGAIYRYNSLAEGYFGTENNNLDATGITLDNIFTDPTDGIYTLKEGSPAIDAGDENLFDGLDANTKDLANNARIYDFNGGGFLDLGAYESSYMASPYIALIPQDGIIHVRETATGDKNGNSWEHATDQLSRAIRTS